MKRNVRGVLRSENVCGGVSVSWFGLFMSARSITLVLALVLTTAGTTSSTPNYEYARGAALLDEGVPFFAPQGLSLVVDFDKLVQQAAHGVRASMTRGACIDGEDGRCGRVDARRHGRRNKR